MNDIQFKFIKWMQLCGWAEIIMDKASLYSQNSLRSLWNRFNMLDISFQVQIYIDLIPVNLSAAHSYCKPPVVPHPKGDLSDSYPLAGKATKYSFLDKKKCGAGQVSLVLKPRYTPLRKRCCCNIYKTKKELCAEITYNKYCFIPFKKKKRVVKFH